MGREYVGIDFHRRRSVVVRMSKRGKRLSVVRIDNSAAALAEAVTAAGDRPQVVLEEQLGVDPLDPHEALIDQRPVQTRSRHSDTTAGVVARAGRRTRRGVNRRPPSSFVWPAHEGQSCRPGLRSPAAPQQGGALP